MHYTCRNYGTTGPTDFRAAVTRGSVWADLIDENGNFHRRAIVANCNSKAAAKKYAEDMNAKNDQKEVTE